MENPHRVRDMLTLGYFFDLLDDYEFALLYDINKPSNPDFNYEEYNDFFTAVEFFSSLLKLV